MSGRPQAAARWLLLMHQLPAKPDYFRVKIWRRLQRIGAVAIKNSVYALPYTDQASEDRGRARRAKQRHPARKTRPAPGIESRPVRGRTWVTRSGVHVDRIASAWLIRRFIDPRAHFRFAPAHDRPRSRGELRFDMYDGEYTHEGDRCTFETLLARFSLHDPALAAIAELVHDIDLKDGKFGRAETAGVERLIAGIVRRHTGDAARIERGAALLDDLYESLGGAARRATAARRRG